MVVKPRSKTCWRVFFRWVHDLDIDDEDPISFPEKCPSCASPSCTFYCYMNSKTERNLSLYINFCFVLFWFPFFLSSTFYFLSDFYVNMNICFVPLNQG